jgi:hypothetical protein
LISRNTAKAFLPAVYIGVFVAAAAVIAAGAFVNYYLIMPGKSLKTDIPPLSAEENDLALIQTAALKS